MLKVMLLGDSIRLGYQARVRQLLEGRATVLGPEDNCRFSAYTLFNLKAWLPDSDYDVIQWNNGQWDTCHMADGKIHTELAAYLELQRRIALILRQQTRRLVFATTTPVWPEQFGSGSVHPRRDEDIRAYNAAAADQCRALGVEVLDLHTPLAADVKHFISADMVHLTDAGIDTCARRIVAHIQG